MIGRVNEFLVQIGQFGEMKTKFEDPNYFLKSRDSESGMADFLERPNLFPVGNEGGEQFVVVTKQLLTT